MTKDEYIEAKRVQYALIQKHVELFSPNCISFDYPVGWNEIVREAFEFCEANGHDIKILQLKEKFGDLRIYTQIQEGYQESEKFNANYKAFNEITGRAYTTCAICGKPSTCMTTGWITPRCDEHENWKYPDGVMDEPEGMYGNILKMIRGQHD